MTTTTLTNCRTAEKSKKEPLVKKLEDVKKIPEYGKYKFLAWEFETPLIWTNIILITLWHIIALYVSLTHSYLTEQGIVIYAFIIGGIGGFGVTGGAHRYWTHKSFKAKLPLRIILLICYSVAGQNSLRDWVRDHRVHHKFSETDADPHNSKRGFFFSHVGWLMMKKHPQVIEKGKTVDCSDLFDDPLVVFHQKYFIWIKILCCFIIPSILPPYIFGESWYNSIMSICFARYVFSLNSTWSVNSAAHIWGYKPYDKRICPVENVSVSLFAMGEGYHNYHHTFPWDYRTSELGKFFNITTFWLNVFEKIGWAYDLKTPSQDLIRRTVEKYGDGTHYKWGQEVPAEENQKFEDESNICT